MIIILSLLLFSLGPCMAFAEPNLTCQTTPVARYVFWAGSSYKERLEPGASFSQTLAEGFPAIAGGRPLCLKTIGLRSTKTFPM